MNLENSILGMSEDDKNHLLNLLRTDCFSHDTAPFTKDDKDYAISCIQFGKMIQKGLEMVKFYQTIEEEKEYRNLAEELESEFVNYHFQNRLEMAWIMEKMEIQIKKLSGTVFRLWNDALGNECTSIIVNDYYHFDRRLTKIVIANPDYWNDDFMWTLIWMVHEMGVTVTSRFRMEDVHDNTLIVEIKPLKKEFPPFLIVDASIES